MPWCTNLASDKCKLRFATHRAQGPHMGPWGPKGPMPPGGFFGPFGAQGPHPRLRGTQEKPWSPPEAWRRPPEAWRRPPEAWRPLGALWAPWDPLWALFPFAGCCAPISPLRDAVRFSFVQNVPLHLHFAEAEASIGSTLSKQVPSLSGAQAEQLALPQSQSALPQRHSALMGLQRAQ